jgi:hypothetical protein
MKRIIQAAAIVLSMSAASAQAQDCPNGRCPLQAPRAAVATVAGAAGVAVRAPIAVAQKVRYQTYVARTTIRERIAQRPIFQRLRNR